MKTTQGLFTEITQKTPLGWRKKDLGKVKQFPPPGLELVSESLKEFPLNRRARKHTNQFSER